MTDHDAKATGPTLLFEIERGVARLTLNRPKVLNALTAGMFLEMERMLVEIEADDEVRTVVLTGAGHGFSSGADLMPVPDDERRRTEAPSFPGDAGGDILDRGNRCILRLRRLPKPVLGSIHGYAVGIGCSLALATDLRIAAETARFGVVFSRIGLGPDGGASALLRELLGTAKTLELLYLGELVDAESALRLGLVNRVVTEDRLAAATDELAERLAGGPTMAYGFAKEAVYAGINLPFESVLDLESRNQRRAIRSQDVREGIRAFREKRKPEFRGR